MSLDHLGLVFGVDGWDVIDYGICKIFRGIGRTAFPIFAYLLVNGWQKTSNRNKYLSRLLLFALLSQIPYTLAFYIVNLMPISPGETANIIKYSGYVFIKLLLILAYWFYYCKRSINVSILWLSASLFMVGLLLKINYIWILSDEYNVFYTLALGLLILDCLDNVLFKRERKHYQYLPIFAMIILAIIFIGVQSDYGIMGLLLIIALYISKNNKLYQIMTICLWGFIFYGLIIGNMYNAIYSCFAAIPVFLYNGRKGINMKYTFYLFYPLHLLILGMVNIFFRFT